MTLSKFKVASVVAIASNTKYNVSKNQSPNQIAPPSSNDGQITGRRKQRGRKKSREISLEMFSNYTGEDLPSPHQLAAEGNLEDLKALMESFDSTIKERDDKGASLLHHATINNQIGIMKYLIDSGIDLNGVDQDGNTSLHLAVAKGHNDALHLLLQNGASDTILNKALDAPLHIIMRNNNTSVLVAFLEHPIDIIVRGYRKRTPLHVAAEKDNVEACEVLHNSIIVQAEFKKIGGFRLCAADEDDLTPIHLAARAGSYRILDLMMTKAIEHGYSPEKVLSFLDEENSTPLHAAVDGGYVEVVEVLLKHKAQPDVLQNKQLPPFLLASSQGRLKMMQLMVQYCGKDVIHCRDQFGQTALHRCAQCINNCQVIHFLVENGAEIDVIDDLGRTPLVSTIIAGSLPGMKALLEKGANILVKDKMGFNSLHYAVKHKRKLIVHCLLQIPQARDLVTDCDKKGNSPIHYALNLCLNNIVSLMVTTVMQQMKNIKDDKGNNYLHLAAFSGDSEALSILLDIPDCHKLLNETNSCGATPLHSAAGKGHVRAVETLLSYGAMVHKCHRGITPFHYACLNGHSDVAKITFEAHPFQLSWTDDSGNTALHHGASSGSPCVITLLLDIGTPITVNNNQESFFEMIIDEHDTKCAMAVIKHERWKECLDVFGSNDHPMLYLVRSMPEIAKMVLDRSFTKSTLAREHPHFWEMHDFKYLQLIPTASSVEEIDQYNDNDDEAQPMLHHAEEHYTMVAPVIKYKGSSTRKGPLPRQRKEKANSHLDVLRYMVKFNRVPLLVHPVTENYLKAKWRTYGRWIQLAFTLLMFLQVAFVILFTFLSPQPADLFNSRVNVTCENTNGTNSCISDTVIQFSLASKVVRIITIVITALNMLHWLLTTVKIGIKESLNITRNTFILIDALAVISTMVYVLPWTSLGFEAVVWEAGALASLFTWFSLVLKLQLFDVFGVYITMILAITRTVFQVLLICFFFIAAFSISLFILAGNLEIFSNIGYSLFTNFGQLLGEIDYAYYIENDVSGKLAFSTLTFMFVIALAITLTLTLS